jgi:ATP-binding cassette subfamily B protein
VAEIGCSPSAWPSSAACLSWGAGWMLNDRRAELGLPAAPAGRGQARRLAVVVLRPAAPRRAAQPRHQRHRQRRQTLQQTLSQLLNNLLTLIGVLFMMFWVSPTLAIIAIIAVPVSLVVPP